MRTIISINKVLTLVTFIWLSHHAGLKAQQNKNTRQVQVRLVCDRHATGLQTISISDQSGGFQKHTLSTRYLSKPINTSIVANTLKFYDPNNLPTEENPAKPIASIKIPSTSNSFSVLLFPARQGNKQGVAYHGVVIDMNEFRFGNCCMLNATNAQILMKVDGKNKAILKPGKTNIIRLNLSKNENKAFVELFKLPLSKKGRPFRSSYWNFRQDTREINIIYADKATGRAKMKSIVDVKPPAPSNNTP